MKDLKLDTQGELALGPDGDLAWVDGIEEVKQSQALDLAAFRGSWVLDLDAGPDYLGSVLGVQVEAVRSAELRRAILAHPDVEELLAFELVEDRAAGDLTVKYSARVSSGVIRQTLGLVTTPVPTPTPPPVEVPAAAPVPTSGTSYALQPLPMATPSAAAESPDVPVPGSSYTEQP